MDEFIAGQTQLNINEIKGRGQWSKGIEFLLSCTSMSVGLGNVWRFPYVAYNNGGGAFLIPYLLLLFIIGRPLYYMELVMGQFSGRGAIKVWKCVPAFKGIGFAQLFSTTYAIMYYNFIIGLTIYYFVASFSRTLPWTDCPVMPPTNQTIGAFDMFSPLLQENKTCSELYWEEVLQQSRGLSDVNLINWKLALCLLATWTFVYLAIMKGVTSLGKVAYFTAIFPYVVMVAILIVALQEPGSVDGIKFFFTPKWEKLKDPIVWYYAVEQSFFSLGIGFGILINYSSYNDFRNNVHRDAIIISVLDTFTSILAGCVIFSVLGAMAKDSDKDIDQIVKGGFGLAFVVYPEALSKIKFVPQLWSALFFLMLFTLGIGTSIAIVETILTTIKDQIPSLHQRKGISALVGCVVICILSLPLTTDAGMYIMTLLDNYGAGTALFFYGILETIAIFWIYGLNRFCSDIKFMLHKSVGVFWKITWAFTTPVALIVIFIYGNIEIAKIGNNEEETGIPWWGSLIGWILAAIAIIQVPLWCIHTILCQKGSFAQEILGAFRPQHDWGPVNDKYFHEWSDYKIKENLNHFLNKGFNLNTRTKNRIK